MEAKPKSLLVPCVRELAKKPQLKVPRQYVRTDEDFTLPTSTQYLPQVPVIDFKKLVYKDMELQQLHHACKDWGFFQLINHGVSSELVEKLKLEIEELFNLPMEEKKFWQKADEIEGFGQAFVVSEEQKLNWGDLFFMITLPTHLRNPNLFPKLPLPLRDALEAYSLEMRNLSVKILELLEKALGMDPNDMKALVEEGYQSMRMNYYPPCPEPELAIGLNAHSDASALTILLQINEMERLQIRKDGAWIPVKPLPNAFVINIGDSFEIVSNGIYRSIEHRVTVNSVKERVSIATFYDPKLDVEMGPAPSLITAQNPPLFRRICVADYFNRFLSRELRGKTNLDVMRVQNHGIGSEIR